MQIYIFAAEKSNLKRMSLEIRLRKGLDIKLVGDAEQELEQIKQLLKRRNASQPANQACAGSVFRNPEGDFAGRLIESANLKGLNIGGARVSEKHANFIVNNGTATAADIEALILLVQQKVELAQGYKLVPEVHVVGEHA